MSERADVLVERDGTVLSVQRWQASGPVGQVWVVLLHAAICDSRSWEEVIPRLRGVGPVVAYDRRGFGRSAPSPARFSHLEDLLAVLEATTAGPAWLVGTSMGGGLALDAALSAPELVAGIVLLAPGVSGAPKPRSLDAPTQRLSHALDIAQAGGDLDEVNHLEIHAWLDGPCSAAGRVTGPARDLALEMNRTVLANAAAPGAGASGVDAWSRLEEVAVATTVACGDLDVPYLQEHADQLLKRIPGARRAHLPGMAHLPYLERPDLVADLITTAVTAPS